MASSSVEPCAVAGTSGAKRDPAPVLSALSRDRDVHSCLRTVPPPKDIRARGRYLGHLSALGKMQHAHSAVSVAQSRPSGPWHTALIASSPRRQLGPVGRTWSRPTRIPARGRTAQLLVGIGELRRPDE